MEFFTEAITLLEYIIVGLGAALAIWGGINLMEGYGNDNPGAKSQGMKQLIAGVGVAVIGIVLVPRLTTLDLFNAASIITPFLTDIFDTAGAGAEIISMETSADTSACSYTVAVMPYVFSAFGTVI